MYYVLDTFAHTVITYEPHNSLLKYNLPFTDQQTELQKGEMNYPTSSSL